MVETATQAAGDGPDPSGDAELPARIGPFRILERIGAGGMGVVFLAERREPIEQRVALKVIRTDRLDRTYRARFAMEQTALARMDHPNIARLLDAGLDDGQSWFAMEYVPGTPLSDYCREHRLSIEARLRLFAQVCDGVQHAHIKGILHRDLKPANVLVREIDGRPIAKIIDFGLAQPTDPLQVRATLHESMRQIVGTFAYMSPEQAERTEGDLDTRTDVYSLGVVLYELLTGVVPLDVDEAQRRGLAWIGDFLREHEPKKPSTRLSTMGERLTSAAAERGTSPQRLRASVRGDLDWVTMKALERDRQRRYPTVSELGRDIERYLRHQPVEAGPPGGWYRAKKWLRRHARGVAVAGVGVVLALVAVGTWVQLSRAERRHLRELALDLEIIAGPRLLAEWDRFGLDLRQHGEILMYAATTKAILANVPEQAARAVPDSDPRAKAIAEHTRTVAPALQVKSAAADVLLARFEAVEQAMRGLAAEWSDCVDGIRQDERYAIDSLSPQFGLAPLGKDPVSGLYEFACIASGKVPGRDQEGRLVLDVDSAIVLVLLPGGKFTMGSPDADPSSDEEVAAAERPCHEVTVAPFFLGKGELTFLQCVALEDDPSYWNLVRVGAAVQKAREKSVVCPTPAGLSRGLPVTNIDWYTADRTLRAVGLRHPSEAEWEYAARAGTTGPWSCSVATLRQHANLPDITARAVFRVEETDPRWLAESDGHPAVAPILSFAANAFGLHDMHGNAAEWCADRYANYGGLDPSLQFLPDTRVVRGGSFARRVQASRSAARAQLPPMAVARDVGCRAARALEGYEPRAVK